MTPAWAQRRDALLSDCLVSPDIFHQMLDRLGAFVVPYQQALASEAAATHTPLPPGAPVPDATQECRGHRGMGRCGAPGHPRLHRHGTMGSLSLGDRISRTSGRAVGHPMASSPSISFPKRGTHSVGVKRQWCGHRGKVDNCQVGVFMGYVSAHDHALLDFRLYLPEEWTRDEHRRQQCHVPLEYGITQREQCLEMALQPQHRKIYGQRCGRNHYFVATVRATL